MGYPERLAGAMRESVPIEGVQDLLDHKHIFTTQIYNKRRRAVKDSAFVSTTSWRSSAAASVQKTLYF